MCGYAVDWLRSCYSSTWRFPLDSVPTRKGYFFFAPEGTPHYPGWSYFGSRNWHKGDGTDWPDFGELEHARQAWRDGSFPTTPPDAKLIGNQECIEFGNTSDTAPAALIAGVNISCWEKRPPWGGLVAGGRSHQATARGGLVGGGSSHEIELAGGLVGGGSSHAIRAAGGLVGGGNSHEIEALGGLVGGGNSHEIEALGGLVGGGSSHAIRAAGGLVGGGSSHAVRAAGGLVGGGSSNFSVIIPGIARRQNAHAQANGSSSCNVNVTWPSATTAGNLLVAIVYSKAASFIPSITPPSGWTNPVNTQPVGTLNGGQIYYMKNAASQSSTGSWTANGGSQTELDVHVIEYSGCSTSAPLISALGNNGGSTSAVTAGIPPGGSSQRVYVVGIGAANQTAFSGITSGFTLVEQFANNGITRSSFCELITTNNTVGTCGVTCGLAQWIANYGGFH